MYDAFWHHLPGPAPVRVAACLLLLALVVAVCFTWVFPWVAGQLPVNDPSLAGAAAAPRTIEA